VQVAVLSEVPWGFALQNEKQKVLLLRAEDQKTYETWIESM
jgi:hypothetical protein